MRAHKRIELLVLRLQSDLRLRLDLGEAAQWVGVEPTYFSRMFYRVTGMRFSDWNRAIRVESAKALLEDGCLDIWQIAEEIGYRNVTTFARNFRKVEGTSPKRYQRLHRSLRIDRVTTRNAEKYARNAEKNTRTSNIPDG